MSKMFLNFWIIFILTCGGVLSLPTLDVKVDYPFNDNDGIFIGSKTVHKFVFGFQNETLRDVVIEIVAPDDTTFALGTEPIVTVGPELVVMREFEGQEIEITSTNYYYFMDKIVAPDYKDPSLPVRYESGLIMHLGNISGVGNSTDSQIEIEVEYFYVSSAGYPDKTENYSSIAMEYNTDEGDFLLIGQIKYTLRDIQLPGDRSEDFDIETTDDPIRGLPSIGILMNIPFAQSKLQVEVRLKNKSLKDIVVSEMRMKSVGNSFLSVNKDNINKFAYSECPLGTSLVLDCGTLINKDAADDPKNSDLNLVVVEAILQSLNKELNGTQVDFVIGIFIDKVAIWLTTDVNFTVNFGPSTPPEPVTLSTSGLADYTTLSPGFPGVAEITLKIPERTSHVFNFVFTTSALSESKNSLSILGMSLSAAGENIDCDTRTTSTVALTLTESQPGSDLFDTANVTLNITNHGLMTEPTEESNIVKFNVYLKMLRGAVNNAIYMLEINLNDFEAQAVEFRAGETKEYLKTTYYDDEILNDCATKTFVPDAEMKFTINVTTERNSVFGPVSYEVAIPTGNVLLFNFQNATTVWRGRNVGCVNPGSIKTLLSEWIDGAKEQRGVFLTFPLICNVEVVDSDIEDTFVIEIYAKLRSLEHLFAADTQNQVFITKRKHSEYEGRNEKDDAFFFSTNIARDLIRTFRVTGAKVPRDHLEDKPFNFKLQWSENNVDFHDFYHNFDEGTNVSDSITYTADRPLYARYVRLGRTGGCTVRFEPETSDFGDEIDFYGLDFSKKEMLQNVMYVLDDDEYTCKSLPTKETTETVQYYWATINTQIMNTDGQSSSFKLQLIGRGLTCAGRPQVTKVMFPKNSATRNFSGIWTKCTLVEQLDGSPMSCIYKCSCSDATTCASVSLLMYHNGIPTEPYEICGVKVIE